MSSKLSLLIALFFVVVAMVAGPVKATDHWVGDDQGWKLEFNYTSWAATKQFHVGDKLSMFFFSFPLTVIQSDHL